MSKHTITLSVLFTASQLVKHYMHVGVSFRNVNRSNSYFVLGVYRNVSIINLSRILPILKKKFFFFYRFMLKEFSDILLINGLRMPHHKYLIKKLNAFDISYFFGRWWNGFIKNYKIFSKPRNTLENNIKIFKLPRFAFHVPFNDDYNDVSGYASSAEFDSVGIHSIVFFDSHKNISQIKSGVMLNTKTLLNNYFLTHLIFSVCTRINFVKKKNFYLETIKHLKFAILDDYENEIGSVSSLVNFDEKIFPKIVHLDVPAAWHFYYYLEFLSKKTCLNFLKFSQQKQIFMRKWKDFLK